MRTVVDTMARVWVTEPGGPSRTRWTTRLVLGTSASGTVAALVDAHGRGESVSVERYDVGPSRGWLETTGGVEWSWVPLSGRPSRAAAGYALEDAAAEDDTDAEVIPLPDDGGPPDLSAFTVPELKRFAAAAGFEGVSKLRRDELLALLGADH